MSYANQPRKHPELRQSDPIRARRQARIIFGSFAAIGVLATRALFAEEAVEQAGQGQEIAPAVTEILELEGDLAYGAFLASECTACHGTTNADIPIIAGLAPHDFVTRLEAYRSGARAHQVMTMVAARLGNEEIAALAAYFETLSPE